MQQSTALSILKSGAPVFLTGEPGAGKTYTLLKYIDFLRSHGIGHAVTAATGIAATHLDGMTIHSWSGLGIRDHLSVSGADKILQRPPMAKRIKHTDVLIIDEISMLKPSFLSMLNTLLQTARRNKHPFGGVQLVLCGDFFQLPPIFANGEPVQYAFEAPEWELLDPCICYITEQHRQDDDGLLSILQGIRSAAVETDHIEQLQSRVGQTAPDDALFLCTHNAKADAINLKAMGQLKGELQTYRYTSFGAKPRVEQLTRSMLAPPELVVRPGAQVMFVRNRLEKGYVNGTVGEVVDFEDDNEGNAWPVVKTKHGHKIVAEPETWKLEDNNKVVAEIEQVPLRLAWAVSVHKSQGMSLEQARIDLRRAFTKGQGYVALSRLTALSGMYLSGFNNTALEIDEHVLNHDNIFRRQSKTLEANAKKASEERVQENIESFILRSGGHLEAKFIKPRKGLTKTLKKATKVSTFKQTLALAEKNTTIDDMAEERGLKPQTIRKHLLKLHNDNPALDLSFYFPPEPIIENVRDTLGSLKTEGELAKDKYGVLKLSPIYNALNAKVTYKNIELALLAI